MDGYWIVRFDYGGAHLGSTSPMRAGAALAEAARMLNSAVHVVSLEPAPEFDDPLEYIPPPLATQRTYNAKEVALLCSRSDTKH